jgi:hypothetical protein
MKDSKFNIAVLIDGDNAQAKLIKQVLEEVSKYGKATIRRIYGDWTMNNMNSWKDVLNIHSISPMQKFSYTTGKNSTDSSLIIDAMDILHSNSVEGFCIVSSDSDYTGLAKRIREEGLFVMGVGKQTTPIAFVNSCEIFTFTEILGVEAEPVLESVNDHNAEVKHRKSPSKPTATSGLKEFAKVNIDVINKAFEISVGENTEVHISKVGFSLRKIDPSFDTRTYGFRTLTQLFESLDNYVVIENNVNGFNHPLVKQK